MAYITEKIKFSIKAKKERHMKKTLLTTLFAMGVFSAGVPLEANTNAVTEKEKAKVIKDTDGSTVEINADGSKLIKKAEGTTVNVKADGGKVIHAPDGTTIEIQADGKKIIKNADGSEIEVHPSLKK
jgi:ABC-type Fe3+-hydroxamate transport system substrate-binding protein